MIKSKRKQFPHMGPEEQKSNGEGSEAQDTSSLEGTSVSTTDTTSLDASTTGEIKDAAPARTEKGSLFQRVAKKVNLYLLLFVLLLIVSGGIVLITYLANKQAQDSKVETQSLSDDTLQQLATTDVTVGQPKQVLNVQSNAVFAGKVLVRDSLEVAGAIQVGGSLSVPGITVSGNSIFEQLQVNDDLAVQGNTSVQGQLSVQQSLTVAGTATFGGNISAQSISVNSLQLNGDLVITRHFAVGGATPSRSNGSALGSGGTVAVSGSDTAGSVNINTGNSASAGCFLTISFTEKYNSTPRVNVTPIGSGAANVGYYVNRSTSSFSICAANNPPSNASFGFDYWTVE